jgi:hypothetical protein
MDSATLAKTSWLFVSFGDAGVNILITIEERPFTPPRGCQTSWVSAHQDMTCHGPRRRTARIRSSVEGNQGLTRNMSYTKSPAVDPWPPRYGFHGSRAHREGRPQWSVTAVCSST